jgi:hypothetical protein
MAYQRTQTNLVIGIHQSMERNPEDRDWSRTIPKVEMSSELSLQMDDISNRYYGFDGL